MTKITKRVVDAADVRASDYIIWDDELPGFGLRVFASGKRSYVIQYRAGGRSRRYTIGSHGVWTPEAARKEAKIQLGRVAKGENPTEERQLNQRAITIKELCNLYIADLERGVILGKGNRPKKASTISTDIGRLRRHIIPLFGSRRVKDLTRADVNKALKDIMAGATAMVAKTNKLRGKSIVRGGPGTAVRTIGLLGGVLTYAMDCGIIETNPTHGIRKPKYRVRDRRLNEAEYRLLGRILRAAVDDDRYGLAAEIIKIIALTGCRRGEIINLARKEVDFANSCLRLEETKEGKSVRPLGLSALEAIEARRDVTAGTYLFPGLGEDNAFGSFPQHWTKLLEGTELAGITAHVLRHSFASIANDLGFTEVTIAALIGHAKGSITGRYIHTLDTALIMAADMVSGYIQGLLDGIEFERNSYALDRQSRKAALAKFLLEARGVEASESGHEERKAA